MFFLLLSSPSPCAHAPVLGKVDTMWNASNIMIFVSYRCQYMWFRTSSCLLPVQHRIQSWLHLYRGMFVWMVWSLIVARLSKATYACSMTASSRPSPYFPKYGKRVSRLTRQFLSTLFNSLFSRSITDNHGLLALGHRLGKPGDDYHQAYYAPWFRDGSKTIVILEWRHIFGVVFRPHETVGIKYTNFS